MKAIFTDPFSRELRKLTPGVQKKFEKQLQFLLKNLKHPSLRAKKYDEAEDVWQARISGNYRFYFRIHGDCYKIIAIIKHPK